MARQRRIQIPGLIYHVMSRGNARMKIFLDEIDYRKLVYTLTDVVDEYDLECWNYCLMPNHYHLTVRPTKANLSSAMHKLNSVYASWWNNRHQRVGHVFQGRFKSQIVQREGYLMTLCRYIALNPVRAQLVADPSEWEWSSYRATVGLRPVPGFLSIEGVLGEFGRDDAQVLQARFTEFVSSGSFDFESAVERIRSNERILGDKAFKTAVKTRRFDSGLAIGDQTVSHVDEQNQLSPNSNIRTTAAGGFGFC